MTLHQSRSPLHIVLLFGGQSTEYEVSLVSALHVLHAIDSARYNVTLVRINQDGTWTRLPSTTDLHVPGEPVFLRPDGRLASLRHPKESISVDVVFPVLHGANGEDGTVQGLLKMYRIPCVGPGALSSSVCMDKDVSKRLLREAGIPVPRFTVLRCGETKFPSYDILAQKLGRTLFVKPANTGSSIGISRIESLAEYQQAVELAFGYDDKILVEEEILGREIECAALGRNPVQISVCGEIQTNHPFYSYQAKYHDESATDLIIPALLSDSVTVQVQEMAQRACQVLECYGMARVDFFLEESGRLLVNEVNTIPGFTSVSMYPLLWEHSGLSFSELVDVLIQDAYTVHERHRQLLPK